MTDVPKLEPRLQAVADFIRAEVHADIGSDHAQLPRYLLASGRAKRIIAVEKTRPPFERSQRALRGLAADVRLGDGLAPLAASEVDSLSVCGVGAHKILKIFARQPDKLPPKLVLQANDKPELLRCWARSNGYHLTAEAVVAGFWRYVILSFKRVPGADPIYWQANTKGISPELALLFGPHLLVQQHPLLYKELLSRRAEYEKLGASKNPLIARRLDLMRDALAHYSKTAEN